MNRFAPQRLVNATCSSPRRIAAAKRCSARAWLTLGGLLSLAGLLPAAVWAQSPLQRLFDNVPGWSDATQPAAEGETLQPPQEAQPTSQQSAQPSSPTLRGVIPPAGAPGLELTENNGLISLVARDASLSQVVASLATSQRLNIVAGNDIDAIISITLHDVPVEEALTAILEVANYTWVRRNNIIVITSLLGTSKLPADVQGRQLQVFELDFASGTEVAKAVEPFLSPIGQVAVSESLSTDNRRTRETVVVEDLPHALARIANYIHFIDQPPRQVLIEAHILEVNLNETNRSGVDFAALFRVAGSTVNIVSVPSLAVPIPTTSARPTTTTPALLATLSGSDLNAVIELLQTTTDTKTLGSPKLLVLNGQEARIQIGRTLYYSQITTTQTSSQQGAGSIETGVIMKIMPRITRDGRVLLSVAPEVSAAGERETPDLPPDTSTTKLETEVMLDDGQGMVIGGLIEEKDSVSQSKVPYLGNIKGVGWFFRRSTVTKERKEIIVALVPRIQPYEPQYQAFEQGELVKAGVPLFHGALERSERPWDPILPDGRRVSVPLNPLKAIQQKRDVPYWPIESSSYFVPSVPVPQQQFQGESICPPAEFLGSPQSGPFLSDEASPTRVIFDGDLPPGAIISDQTK